MVQDRQVRKLHMLKTREETLGAAATKPYLARANYIHKMGDLCDHCVFDYRQRHGERACPLNFLYWNFLLQHEERLHANFRTSRSALGLRYLTDKDRDCVQRKAEHFLRQLSVL